MGGKIRVPYILMRCPICGAPAEEKQDSGGRFTIQCSNYDCGADEELYFDDNAFAVNYWNDLCYEAAQPLKPCPFCGGEARALRMGWPHWIYCTQCGAKVHGGVMGTLTGEIASIKAWNRRITDG